ncbi:hypothetical protein [Kitasatospora sp. NPDC097643]|uniref:hypothetical protein n=1 Tax=Kitasatospora sp. NPDC097643 TaxID=3157230 RepID=UPI0033212E97
MVITQQTAGERRALRTALGVLALLAVLTGVGRFSGRSGGLLVLSEWFDRPLLMVSLALPVLLVVLYCVTWRAWIRVVLGIGVLLTALGTVPLWLFFDHDPYVTRTEVAPGRADRQIVEAEYGAFLRENRDVYLDQGAGLTTRRWRLVHATPAFGGAFRVAWVGADRVRLEFPGGRTELIELAADGRPSSSFTLG